MAAFRCSPSFLFCLLAVSRSISAYGQVKLDATSKVIFGNNNPSSPPPAVANNSAIFTVINLPANTSVSAVVAGYATGQPTGWLDAKVIGNKVTVTTNISSNKLVASKYGAFVYITVGSVTMKATVSLVVFPQDNQFRFVDDSGSEIDETAGVTLRSSGPQSSPVTIYFNDLTGSTKQLFTTNFQSSDGAKWLTVSPAMGTTGTTSSKVVLQALPAAVQSSAQYEGFLIVTSGDPNKTGSLPVHFVADQAATPCTYALSAPSSSAGAGAGSGSLNLTTQAGCAWVGSSDSGWLHIVAGSSGTGTGTIMYSFDANGGTARMGHINAQGQQFTLSQAAAASPVTQCTYALSSQSASVGIAAGSGYLILATQAGCVWVASSDAAWLHIVSGFSGTGTGTIMYSYDANAGAARTGDLYVQGQQFMLAQAAAQAPTLCTYTLSAQSGTASAGAGSGTLTLYTKPGCAWNAGSNAAWLHIVSGSSGMDSGTIMYSYDANTGAARTGDINAQGQQFVLSQPAASPPSAPAIQTFAATPSSVNYGSGSTLSWSVTGAATVSIDQDIGPVASSGNLAVLPGRATTYTLTAANAAGNTSATATVTVNGQPPSGLGILTASPNPILVSDPSVTVSSTTLYWAVPGAAQTIDLRVNAPGGASMGLSGPTGSGSTGVWVNDGMTFYLQDVTNGPPALANTIDTIAVRVVPAGQLFFAASPLYVAPGGTTGFVNLTWNSPGFTDLQVLVNSSTGPPLTTDVPGTGSTVVSGDWLAEGITFFLQNNASGNSAGDQNTVTKVQVTSSPLGATTAPAASVSALEPPHAPFFANSGPLPELRWLSVPDADAYDVEIDPRSAAGWCSESTSCASFSWHLQTTSARRPAGTGDFRWRVRATNGAASGRWTSWNFSSPGDVGTASELKPQH